jgi:nucleotide-binding universal stress UspA family protein
MTRTIVVGYDGSEHADDALALGRLLAGRSGAELVVACAYPEDPLDTVAATEIADELRADAEQALARARETMGVDGRVDYRAIAGQTPSQVLHEIAEELGAAAIVVGASHHGTVLRMLSGGGTPEHVLDHAPCPVAVAPEGFAARAATGLARVTVAFDGSPEAARALDAAAALARDAELPLRLVTAVNVAALSAYPPLDLTSYEQLAALAREEAGRRLEEAAGSVTDLPVETTVLEGDPVDALADDAEVRDLLVAGSGAKGPLRRVLLGSVSRHLLRAAPCAVVVVPRGDDD